MKPLLSKTTRPFLIYTLIVFLISVPVYYFVVDGIWKSELDEHNKIIIEKTLFGFNRDSFSNEKVEESIRLWNEIQPGTDIQKLQPKDSKKDSIYTIYRVRHYSRTYNEDRFRCMSKVVEINKKLYRITVETNIEETDETVMAIAITTILFFLLLVVGLLILNRKLSVRVWQPFQDTLHKLKSFELNSQKGISFQETDIIEFAELNATLDKLLQHTIITYKNQKEFTENASHELQTPLAILKNKLDILLQSNGLTERQYHIAEEMNKALIRSSRISKNLLLLAKIENSQFDSSELIGFDTLVEQSMDGLQAHFKEKNITASSDIHPDIEVKGNGSLTEALINNLIVNAIRHTSPGGAVKVTVSKSGFEVRNSGRQSLDENLLFKRFSRMSADNSGSGLGLSIVQEICKLHSWKAKYNFERDTHVFSVTF